MEAVNTLKGYGKVEDAAEKNLRRNRRRLAVASAVLLLAFVIAAVACIVFLFPRRNSSPPAVAASSPPPAGHPSSPPPAGNHSSSSPANSLSTACRFSADSNSCISILSSAGANSSTDPQKILKISLRVSADEVSMVSGSISKGIDDPSAIGAVNDCKELLSDAADQLNASISLLDREIGIPPPPKINDLRTWLSAALTDHDTCLDSFEEVEGNFREKVDLKMRNSTIYIKNSLAIASHIEEIARQLRLPIHRKLLSHA